MADHEIAALEPQPGSNQPTHETGTERNHWEEPRHGGFGAASTQSAPKAPVALSQGERQRLSRGGDMTVAAAPTDAMELDDVVDESDEQASEAVRHVWARKATMH